MEQLNMVLNVRTNTIVFTFIWNYYPKNIEDGSMSLTL